MIAMVRMDLNGNDDVYESEGNVIAINVSRHSTVPYMTHSSCMSLQCSFVYNH